MSLYLCEKRIKSVFSSSSSIWDWVSAVLFGHDSTLWQKGTLLSQLDSAQKTRAVRYQQNHVHTCSQAASTPSDSSDSSESHDIKLEWRWWVMVQHFNGSTMILTALNLPPGGVVPLLFPCRTRTTPFHPRLQDVTHISTCCFSSLRVDTCQHEAPDFFFCESYLFLTAGKPAPISWSSALPGSQLLQLSVCAIKP